MSGSAWSFRKPAWPAVWLATALFLSLAHGLAGPSAAQGNPFRPVIFVNDSAITAWELDQRIAILRLFRSPGDPTVQAREALIDERLQLAEAARVGIETSEEEVLTGMEEFATRANLSLEEFIGALEQGGVSVETYRDFVRAGVTWRSYIRQRFGPIAGQISEEETDRALQLSSRPGTADALISEIILPVRNPEEQVRAEEITRNISATVRGESAFAAAAREFSAAPTRDAGGRVAEPVNVGSLPPAVREQILTLGPGEVTAPITLGGAIGVFLLRELRDTGRPDVEAVRLDYARYLIPAADRGAAAAEAARVRALIDECDDLYAINQGQPEERLVFESQLSGEVPPQIALELAKLDENEVSTAIVRDGVLVFVMLCSRQPEREEEVDLGRVRAALIDQRLQGYSQGLVAELRAAAIIREP
ncbi:MAG: peptidylprolyl isomerase [Pseudomonadota bacterium]